MTAVEAKPLDLSAPLIIGFGIASQAAAAALLAHGHRPKVTDDRPTDASRAAAREMGVELVEAPDRGRLAELVAEASVVLPSPGIPDHHPVFELAGQQACAVASEFDLAQRWDDRPVVAITGTNGKTTVTMMVADALNRSGRSADPVGNTDVPFVEAIENGETEVFVVEASSFRLAHSARFEPNVAAWLNFAPDHLDAHATLADYEDAKASVWRHLATDGVIVANADDPVVMGRVPDAGLSVQTFSILGEATWYVDRTGSAPRLAGPDGAFINVSDLTRTQPHDLSNALAVAAIAIAAGATTEGVNETLTSFAGLAHRLEFLGRWDDISWYNDSKATVPHATVAAVGGFDSVVLIAGGRSKGLSFEPLRDTVPPVRSVVAIGDAAAEIDSTFADLVPVTRAASMIDAIHQARALAGSGDAVLLSPACASFDWYPNYVERGIDFTNLVRAEVPKT